MYLCNQREDVSLSLYRKYDDINYNSTEQLKWKNKFLSALQPNNKQCAISNIYVEFAYQQIKKNTHETKFVGFNWKPRLTLKDHTLGFNKKSQKLENITFFFFYNKMYTQIRSTK